MLSRLILLFVLVPLTDLFLLMVLSAYIGWPTSVGIVIASGILGAFLARQSGLAVSRKIQQRMAQGQFSAELLTDGAIQMVVNTAAVVLVSAANAQSDFDFTGVDAQLAGEPTRALVLGSAHIAQMPEDVVQIEHLALVLDRLEDFAPDVVAVEALDGMSCERLQRYVKLYPRVANRGTANDA